MSKSLKIAQCITVFICFLAHSLIAQSNLSGTVNDRQNKPINDAVVIFQKQTVLTNDQGYFQIPISADLPMELIVSRQGFKTKRMMVNVNQTEVTVILIDSHEVLSTAVVKSNKYAQFSNYAAQSTKLSKMDALTSPSSLGDVFANLTILPGVQSNSTDGRLIIQGGAHAESQFYVNDLIVFNPYSMALKNTPSRSKFSPDLFDGVSLQAGGYGSEYGQALAGVVNLNTLNRQGIDAKTDLSLSSVGLGVTQIGVQPSYTYRASVDYTDLYPYDKLFPDEYEWTRAYQEIKVDLFLSKDFNTKTQLVQQLNYNRSTANYSYHNVDQLRFNNDFSSHYALYQANFHHTISTNKQLRVGSNLIYDAFRGSDVQLQGDEVDQKTLWNHNKIELRVNQKQKISHKFGLELINHLFAEDYTLPIASSLSHTVSNSFNSSLASFYTDTKWTIAPQWSVNVGLRGEYAFYLQKANLAPRIYCGYQFRPGQSFSISAGSYYQMPEASALKMTDDLQFTRSNKITASYVYAMKADKLQMNLYYNQYKQLIRYERGPNHYTDFSNLGSGNGWGYDFFWKKQIGPLEYWLSYAFNDTEKAAGLWHTKVQPSYLSKHNLSVNIKLWIKELRSQLGLGSTIASGQPYYNERNLDLSGKTKSHSQFNLTWSFLPSQQIILHAACQNVFGTKNVYGYEFSELTDGAKRPIVASNTRFYYLGLFITLSKNKTINQLKSL